MTTLELAKAIDFSLDNGIVGLIHLSNGVGISKFDLLNLFKEIWGKDTVIKPYDGNEVDKSIEKSLRLDYEVPSYRQMLVEQFEMMKSYSNLYSAY